MRKPEKSIPKFRSEAEERAFWEKHDSADYLDWSAARAVVLPNLKPTTKTISLRLAPWIAPSRDPDYPCSFSFSQTLISDW